MPGRGEFAEGAAGYRRKELVRCTRVTQGAFAWRG